MPDNPTPRLPGQGMLDYVVPEKVLRARRIAGYRREVRAGTKYKQNDAEKELIGITDGILFWASTIGVDNSTDDAGLSGLHLTLFDTSTRADSAQIKLLNDSGVTQYVVAAAIKAKPIVRLSGEQGFVHDSFVDYQDIFLNGENTFEFGNNFVVTKAQVEQLADYYAKVLGTITTTGNPKAKHIYAVSIPGRCWWFEPGEWYTLQVGGAGEREYIDSVVECYDVTVEAAADSLGMTNIAFREVEQNWVKDSNSVARFLATGDPRWKPNNFGRVIIAAKDYLGVADYYCDGTADDVEIQAAIDYLANTFDGGLVQLTEGQYNTTAVIDLSHDNMILIGQGGKTIIEKNCNDYGIKIQGTSSVEIRNTFIQNLRITRNSADTNVKSLVYIVYASACLVESCVVDNSYGTAGIQIGANTGGIKIYKCTIRDNVNSGISFVDTYYPITIIGCQILSNGVRGIADSSNASNIISENVIQNNGLSFALAADEGILCSGYRTKISNNVIENNIGIGINISGYQVQVRDNMVTDNGNLLINGGCE